MRGAIWSPVNIFWFVTCYSIQQVLGCRITDIMVGPTAIMAGILAALLVLNILFMYIMLERIFPWIFITFVRVSCCRCWPW